jgi:alpha-tubulin N-acetyltransferase 1
MFSSSIAKWDSQKLGKLSADEIQNFSQLFDQLGFASGKAQDLDGPITSTDKLLASQGQILLIYTDSADSKPTGFVKYGCKDLFLYRRIKGKMVYSQMDGVMCVLDYYVSSSHQRKGIGLVLFQEMLKDLDKKPEQLAYDRPSNKLLAFLSKHYGLNNADHQPNRFTLYDGFFP